MAFNTWSLIVIKDNKYLEERSFSVLLEALLSYTVLNYAFIDSDIQGTSRHGLDAQLEINQGFIKISQCLDFFSKVSLEWGNFFLFDKIPENWEQLPESDPFQRIAYSKMTIRAADSNYILVYTRDDSLFEKIKPHFNSFTIESAPLIELWYPE